MYASTLEAPVLLVGTAHVIDVAEPLRKVLSGRDLQGIAIELDNDRARTLLETEPKAARGPPESVPFFLQIWSLLQRRLGEDLGAGAGAEMKAAAALSMEWKIPLFLIDDPVRETVIRLFRNLSFKERVGLVVGGIVGMFIPSRFIRSQIGEYTRAPEGYLEELRREFPGVTRILLDDRNEHMAARLTTLRHQGFGRIAAVVGDAHLNGLAGALRRRGVPVELVSFGTLTGLKGP
ncbi:MAG: TraB domain-containing protein [Thermoplasmata archaeon]